MMLMHHVYYVHIYIYIFIYIYIYTEICLYKKVINQIHINVYNHMCLTAATLRFKCWALYGPEGLLFLHHLR